MNYFIKFYNINILLYHIYFLGMIIKHIDISLM